MAEHIKELALLLDKKIEKLSKIPREKRTFKQSYELGNAIYGRYLIEVIYGIEKRW